MNRTYRALILAVILAAVGGLVTGLALIFTGGTASRAIPSRPGAYQYYQSMMSNVGGQPMMGGSRQTMMGQSGYAWMTGGAQAPGWMAGGSLPSSMMGLGADPGTVMGKFWAGAPGARVSTVDASRLGNQHPVGARVDTPGRRITFTAPTVHLTVLASPSMPLENFRIAGMTNPTIVVPAGARVSLQLINADTDMAHGLVITSSHTPAASMPMMSTSPAWPGAALWFLGESTSTGMHTATLTFIATTPGTYRYLCPVPNHAQEGMIGSLIVTN